MHSSTRRPIRRTLLSIALLGCAASVGSCKDELPAEIDYAVQSLDLSLEGATVALGTQTATFERKPWSDKGDHVIARFKLPRSGPSMVGDVKLALATPCGVKEIPLTTQSDAAEQETKQKEYSAGRVSFDVDAPTLPPAAHVWVDSGKETVKLGSAELKHGDNVVFDPACKEGLTFLAGETKLGAFTPPADPKQDAVFVTSKKDQCYGFELVVYGAEGIRPKMLVGAQVHEISALKIDYFLQKAPSSKQVAGGARSTNAYELVNVPCPAPPDAN